MFMKCMNGLGSSAEAIGWAEAALSWSLPRGQALFPGGPRHTQAAAAEHSLLAWQDLLMPPEVMGDVNPFFSVFSSLLYFAGLVRIPEVPHISLSFFQPAFFSQVLDGELIRECG